CWSVADWVVGGDGNVWFHESANIDKQISPVEHRLWLQSWIGKITPQGTVTRFELPESASSTRLTWGPDGNIWFLEPYAERVGRLTPEGQVSEYTGVTELLAPNWEARQAGGDASINAGPDGNVWVTEPTARRIARVEPSGVITEFDVPASMGVVYRVYPGLDGTLWGETGGGLARISPSGEMTPIPDRPPGGLSLDANGKLLVSNGVCWSGNGSSFSRVAADATRTEWFAVPDTIWGLESLALGPDGNVWFTTNEATPPQVVRLDPNDLSPAFSSAVTSIQVAPGGRFDGVLGNFYEPNLYESDRPFAFGY